MNSTIPPEDAMQEPVRLGPREQEIVNLLLQGCGNAEIADTIGMNRRTVKAHFNRLFAKFGISGGIKRVKLATLVYRRQLCLENQPGESVPESGPSSHSWPVDSPTETSQRRSRPLSSSLRTTSATST